MTHDVPHFAFEDACVCMCPECVKDDRCICKDCEHGEFTDPDREPDHDGLEDHQVWVWMQGARPPRWEIRGTGAALDEGRT
jgi:hypothetical protein